MSYFDRDLCIHCGKELSSWERTRSYCWECNELSTVTYYEEEDSSYLLG